MSKFQFEVIDHWIGVNSIFSGKGRFPWVTCNLCAI